MKVHQARKLTDEALSQLKCALEQGTSKQLQALLAMMARFHRYSLGNLLLIAMQQPKATRVAGYRYPYDEQHPAIQIKRHRTEVTEGPLVLQRYPKATWTLGWQYLFASRRLSRHPTTGQRGRWHVHENLVERAVNQGDRTTTKLVSAMTQDLPPPCEFSGDDERQLSLFPHRRRFDTLCDSRHF